MKEEYRRLTLRLPLDSWEYVRQLAFDQRISLNEVIVRAVKKDEENRKKLLTNYDSVA